MTPDERPHGVHARLEVRLEDMPDVLAGLRLEMAQVVREAAHGRSAEVREFAELVACAFEAGQREET